MAGCRVAFRAPGLAWCLRGGCDRGAVIACFPLSGCSLMLLGALLCTLLGAICCFISPSGVCVGCFLLLPAAHGLASVLPICVVGPRSWACVTKRYDYGPAFCLGEYLLGLPALVCSATLAPTTASLCDVLSMNGIRCAHPSSWPKHGCPQQGDLCGKSIWPPNCPCISDAIISIGNTPRFLALKCTVPRISGTILRPDS